MTDTLCYSIVYYCNGEQRFEQFLQIDQLYRTSMLLGLLSIIRAPLYLRSSWCYIRSKFFLPLVSWAWWHWTNHCPSLQLYYWLGHTTHEMVSKMTYNVSSGTLNPTIPYHRHLHLFIVPFTSVIGLAWQCQYGKHLQRMSDKCSGGGIIWLCMVYTTWHYTKTETWHKRAEAEAHWQLGLYFPLSTNPVANVAPCMCKGKGTSLQTPTVI